MMKLNYKLRGMFIGVLLILTACSSAEERIQAEYNALLLPDSILLYEYTDSYSGATGSCAGVFIDRWYGSEVSYSSIIDKVEDQLSNNGWGLWPEDVGRKIWRKQGQKGLFSLSILSFTTEDSSNPRGLYALPDSFLIEAEKHSTVYVISLRYMTPAAAKRCFGK